MDDSFDSEKFYKFRLKIAHDGLNRKDTIYSLETYELAKPSLSNSPILANVIVDECSKTVDLGGHDFFFEKNKINSKKNKKVYVEQPVGVIPETHNYEIREVDGRNFVFADAYIFKQYCNYLEEYIAENKEIKLSMEIFIDDFRENPKNKNTYFIDKFRYKGITLLGESRTTGMFDALATEYEIKPIEADFLEQLKYEIEQYEIKNKGVFDLLKKEDGNLDKIKDNKELNEKIPVNETVAEEVVGGTVVENSETEEVVETVETSVEETESSTEEYAMSCNIFGELSSIFGQFKDNDGWSIYYVYDYDFEKKVVYVSEWKDNISKYFAYNFDLKGDKVEVDFKSKTRVKLEFSEYKDGEDRIEFNPMSDFVEYSKTHKYTNEEYEAISEKLKEYETEKEKALFDEKVKEVYALFEDIQNTEEFAKLKEQAYEINDLVEIKKECYFIRGEMKSPENYSVEEKPAKNKASLLNNKEQDFLFGGLLDEVYKK